MSWKNYLSGLEKTTKFLIAMNFLSITLQFLLYFVTSRISDIITAVFMLLVTIIVLSIYKKAA